MKQSLADQLRALAIKLETAMSRDEIEGTTLDFDVVSAILIDLANGYSADEIAESLNLPED